jgi:hypothetical protein
MEDADRKLLLEQAIDATQNSASLRWSIDSPKQPPKIRSPKTGKMVATLPAPDDGHCPRCRADVPDEYRVTVECTGAKVRGCMRCIDDVVVSYSSSFRTNVLANVEGELAAAKKERAANKIAWAAAEVMRFADKAAREAVAEQERAKRR